ncbi:MAG: MarR family transcriptional regulator [Aquamicrobium sp.]|uniref:MarR family winged helix-turn-helix transcriptional regulator n=1 Tax=Aquamicrobium sp. TaxID=1872579 RepID=UPI00349EBAA6|nr:MarR family transcriptional regulator [Aquamicrobium sp.]
MVRIGRDKSAGYMTNWAARLFARAIDRRLKPLGLSSAHMPVMFALGDGREMSQKALAQAASIEQPTMAATLSRMERDGLVQRRPDPGDRRAMLFSLTPQAAEKADAVHAAAVAVNARALSALAPQERDAFLGMLARVVAGLGEDERG